MFNGTMTEEHKTKCISLPWCVIWIEDEDTEKERKLPVGHKTPFPKAYYERMNNAQTHT